jgi:hypothetical protein
LRPVKIAGDLPRHTPHGDVQRSAKIFAVSNQRTCARLAKIIGWPQAPDASGQSARFDALDGPDTIGILPIRQSEPADSVPDSDRIGPFRSDCPEKFTIQGHLK